MILNLDTLPEISFEEWERRSRDMGIFFSSDDSKPPVESLLLTRYTLDKMDESWNKILETKSQTNDKI